MTPRSCGIGPETRLAPARRKVMLQKFARHAASRLQGWRDPGVQRWSIDPASPGASASLRSVGVACAHTGRGSDSACDRVSPLA